MTQRPFCFSKMLVAMILPGQQGMEAGGVTHALVNGPRRHTHCVSGFRPGEYVSVVLCTSYLV
jgi:hypothetical protein